MAAASVAAVGVVADVLDSHYSWARLGVTLSAGIIGNAPMWMIVVILPAVQAEYEVSREEVTLPMTLAYLGYGFGNAVIGRAVDRFGIVPPLCFASVVASTSFVLASISHSLVLFSVLHFALGLCAAATFAPLASDVSLWFVKSRGIAVSIAASGNYASGNYTGHPPLLVIPGPS
jgi:sugar phosphate permease